jgi:hypothetical protein
LEIEFIRHLLVGTPLSLPALSRSFKNNLQITIRIFI